MVIDEAAIYISRSQDIIGFLLCASTEIKEKSLIIYVKTDYKRHCDKFYSDVLLNFLFKTKICIQNLESSTKKNIDIRLQ
jgi:hypothetical protein